ncbi:STAS domain-containing protein [Aquabacterium sp. J223]|uniref:STAS domain-containing protein n=1 Tax=Aquabacterium sp. J223 TaxID=2898431 RepID=UPI0021AE0B8F|nr:STAS domain-containing protein [Aquabacterium sp. J223]UUX94748.1 STAS domain-containing protein [Aquabacterium sp. J223]
MTEENVVLEAVLRDDETKVLQEWLQEAAAPSVGGRAPRMPATREEALPLLKALRQGLAADGADDLGGPAWEPLRRELQSLSGARAAQGAAVDETSRFVLSLKRPLFQRVQERLADQPKALVATVWRISSVVDRAAELTVGLYQQSREDVINRQQQELLELSTPVVKLWDGVLSVPMIGTLDSSRTQLVMEALLQRIVETGSEIAIIDITGVPTVDTLVAQHLLKTVTAIRLMGADCIISGIRPQIAQTIVHLGIDLQGITTKASLADALALALQRTGYRITRDTVE